MHISDSFSFNCDFASPLQKIKISTVSAKVETNEERKETQDRIEEERKHQTEVFFCSVSRITTLIASVITGVPRQGDEGSKAYDAY